MNEIGYTVEARSKAVPEVVDSLTLELKKRGFGVLSNIDVRKIIKDKLSEAVGSYAILDVCSPRYAKKALDAHKEVGLILPCKITVFEDSGSTFASLYKPTEAIKVLEFRDLDPLAKEVEKELKEAIDAVSA